MNRYGKRCVLYPRVSTEMQVDGYSLEGQKNMLTRFADREEMIVVDTYEDAGKSGKSIEGRPAFQKMLRDIEDGLDIDYILVYKLSRFGRNAADILNSLELVQSYGVNLICIEEGIDSSQTSGKLLISVLSAVAEIERENIIEQTMNGRREKARQGGWNGGFAPYGYTLEDNKLMIEETEAVAIRKIFELYTSSEIGLGGIANQLNLQGIRKIPRQNGTLEDWTGHFIKLILDNPVYCGKIAYGRRTKEKVKGTKNDYQMKRNDDYILTEGQHKGIVSEEVWEKAHAKRLRTGVKQPSKIGRDRVHLLSGLLKCPVCGSPMYTNKHAWTNKDGTYKEIYYYVCSRNRMVRGKHCEYKAMLKKTDIEPMVIEAIREIVRNEEYAQAIKKRIGVQIDTKAVDKELEGYQIKLKEVDLNKTRLEREIDSLPADAKYRERKLHDMTLRLDSLYDVIVELEEKIEDARLRRDAIKQQAITLENIYKIMVNFDCVYNIINDEEKRNVVTALIKEIEIYRNDESEYPLKRIGLNFPVFKDGGEVTELLWDKGNTVETIVIALRAMGLAVFLMWVPTIAAIIAGCISQKESNGKISFKKLLLSIGFQKTSIKWILLSCLIPAVYIGIPYVLFWIAFPNSLDMSKASVIQLVLMSVVGIFIGLITAIGEEIGWRGYLVPATLERVGIKKALIYTSIFWGVWHLPILISGLYMPGTPAWYSVPAFLFMIIPVGMIYGIITIKTKSIWPAIFLHAAHNTFDQLIFGTVTVANNKMFFVSETGIFTIIFAWIVAVFLYKKCND